jgi:hypothetical protein
MIIDSGIVTGSFQVIGNTEITGSLKVTEGITGSLKGNAESATSSSYALSASYAQNVPTAISASYALSASSVPYSGLTGDIPTWNQNTTGTAATASYVQNAVSASYALNATNAINASSATSASYALNATNAASSISASNAINADTVDGRHASEFVLNSATSSLATQTYVNTAVSNLVDAAPGTLDTLNELAAALGDDPNFATTVATSIGTKQNQLNGTGFVKASGTTISYDNSTYTPTSRTLTINGTSFDLSADRSWSIAAGVTSFNTRTGGITLSSNDVTTALGYTPYNATNPNGYITGISFANVSSKPTTLSGYGITDAVPSSRTITINGTALDLSADRSFTVSATETDTLASVTGRGSSTSTQLVFGGGMSAWNTTTPGTAIGSIQIGLANGTGNAGGAITFAARDGGGGNNAQAGIYINSDGAYGTRMYLATTDSYSTGARTALSINEGGTVNITRGALQQGGNQVLHAGNFTSYSPTLTGGSASGTWGISITGAAGSATTATNSSQLNGISSTQIFNNMGNTHGTYTNFNSVGNFGVRYLQGNTNGPGTGASQYYGFTLGLGNEYPLDGAGSYATQFYWNRTPTGGNPYVSVRFKEDGSWSGWSKIWAGQADNSGTVGGYSVAVAGSANTIPTRNGSGYLIPENWIQLNGFYGLYSGNNSAHFYPNNNSYGAWKITGERNGWRGIHFGEGTGMTLMMNEGEFGFHREAVGWAARFTAGTGHFNVSGVAARATRANGNFYIDDNFGNTVVGVYSASRLQGVFAMGDAYKLAADGTNGGNLYGLAWSHPNAGRQAGFLSDHGLIHMMYGTAFATISSNIWCRGDIIAYSDARVKANIQVIDNPLERLKKVRGVTFTRTDLKDKEKKYAGVIAQEMLEALPEVVSENVNGELSVSYGNSVSLLIEAVKEQQTQIENQQTQIDELKELVKQLTNK